MKYKIVTTCELKSRGLNAQEIFEYFSNKSFSDILSEALQTNELVSPGLKGVTARCCSSSFKNNVNFLFFSGDVDFIICQRLLMCDSIIIPEHDLCVANPRSSTLKSYIDILTNIPKFEEGEFNGVINGYHRPYHFFYDKLPPLLEGLSEIKNKIPYINITGSFLDLSLIDEKFTIASKEIDEPGFFLVPAKSEYTRTPASFFRNLSTSLTKNYNTNPDKYDFIVWIGMALEKRKWIERTPAILTFIELIKSHYSNPLFIIDGLTSDFLSDPQEIREGKSAQEVAEWEKLKNLVGDINSIDLIGAKAHEKILNSNKVDFYISSHLTDSIWCAALGFKPGLTYQANASRGRGSFIHPLTNCLPASEITDSAFSSTIDYDGLDININPLRFTTIAFYSAIYTKALNDILKKFSSVARYSEKTWIEFNTPVLDIPKNSSSLFIKRFFSEGRKPVKQITCKFHLSDNTTIIKHINTSNDTEILIPRSACKLVFECTGDVKDFSLSKTSIMLKI